MRRFLPMLAVLGASLGVHAFILWQSTKHTMGEFGWSIEAPKPREVQISVAFVDPKDPAIEKNKDLAVPSEKEKDAAKSTEPPKPADPPTPEPVKPDPPKPKPKPPEVEKFPDQIGESTGTGIGTHRAEGAEPIKARQGDQDQAFLSRDPRGPGMVNEDPSRILTAPGQNGTGGVAGRPEVNPSPNPVEPTPSVKSPEEAQAEQTPPRPVVVQAAGPARIEDPQIAQAGDPAPSRVRTQDAVPLQPPPPSPNIGPAEISPSAPAPAVGQKPGLGEAGIVVETPMPSATANLLPVVRQSVQQPGRVDPQLKAAEVVTPRVSPFNGIGPAREVPPSRPMVALSLTPVQPKAPSIFESPDLRPPAPPSSAVATTDETVTPVPPAPAPHPPTVQQTAVARPGNGDGLKPGPAIHAADPAQESDSESDPFARIGSFNAKDGRLDPQFGRKVKTVRPRIPIVGQVDAFTMGKSPSVTLKVNIDATGKVTSVHIHKSSGSNEIDQPCLIAMYDWWFEPLKDKRGNPIPDTLLFTISFR